MSLAVSPELALVDPALREHALESLPRVEPFDFLRFEGAPRRHPDLELFGFLADYDEAETIARRPPLPVAALGYLVGSLAAFVPFAVLVIVAVAAVVLVLNIVA